MTAKVRIKVGLIEFEYEGDTKLGLPELKELFSHIETLSKVPLQVEPTPQFAAGQPATSGGNGNSGGAGVVKLHVNSVAQKMKAKTGSELALAAAVTLQVCEGKETFSRTELLDMMKKATMHYSANMSGNLTKILGVLVGSKFNQINDGVYSLAADEYHKLAAQIA